MRHQQKTFPNLFLLGAPKSGTTFIYNILKNSSDVFSPHIKEPAYFLVYGQKITYKDKRVTPPPSSFDEDKYCDLYAGRTEQYLIDASTHYLSSPETADRIYAANPDAKVIAILREPIGRAYSHYLMGVRDGSVVESFMEALAQEKKEICSPEEVWPESYRFIRRSLYLDGLKAFYKLFGENFRVYLFDDIKSHPDFIVDDLCQFLGLSKEGIENHVSAAEKNPFAVDRLPSVTRLVQRYRESTLRRTVNRITPVAVRDKIRTKFDKYRLKEAPKPGLDGQARQVLVDALGDDFEVSIAFAKEKSILKSIAN